MSGTSTGATSARFRDRSGKEYQGKSGRAGNINEIRWVAKRLSPRRANSWKCECPSCGHQTTISARNLDRHRLPACPKCGPRLRSIEEIEKTHSGYVCGKNSGYGRTTLRKWRKAGFLIEGERPAPDTPPKRLVKPASVSVELPAIFFKERVVGSSTPVRFYPIGALLACEDKSRLSAIAARSSARWPNGEEVARFGKKLVSESYVRRALGDVPEQTFRHWKTQWNKDGNRWPILNPGHAKPETYKIDGRTRYVKEQVDKEMKENLEKLPTTIPEDHPTLYSYESALLLVGSRIYLLGEKARRQHNISTEPYWVRFEYRRRRKKVVVLMCVNGYTRKSIDDFVVKQIMCELPPQTIPYKRLALVLRKASRACTLDPGLVLKWCNDGLLDAVQTDYMTKTGMRHGWIVSDESRKAVKELLRKHGWDAKAVTNELRNLRLAEPGLVVKRIAEQHEKGRQRGADLAARREALLEEAVQIDGRVGGTQDTHTPGWVKAEVATAPAGESRAEGNRPRLRPTWEERKEIVLNVIRELGKDSEGEDPSGKKILKELRAKRIPQRPATTWKILGELKEEGKYTISA